jgi:hypothetical protein
MSIKDMDHQRPNKKSHGDVHSFSRESQELFLTVQFAFIKESDTWQKKRETVDRGSWFTDIQI